MRGLKGMAFLGDNIRPVHAHLGVAEKPLAEESGTETFEHNWVTQFRYVVLMTEKF
jgi:hypothetical protein